MPPAQDIDGPRAKAWQANTTSPNYADNCAAAESDAIRAMQLSAAREFRTIKGWFNETLRKFTPPEPIAVLRLDADWYDSTMCCLTHLFPHLADGGVVVFDDYYQWDGCAKAVHEYVAKRPEPIRLREPYEGLLTLTRPGFG